MKQFFSQNFFINNRRSFRNQQATDLLIVLTANSSVQKASDISYPFSQERNFWYLTGIDVPNLILVMNGVEEYLILPERSSYQDIFDGLIDRDELSNISGIIKIYDHQEGLKLLAKKIRTINQVGSLTTFRDFSKMHGFFINPALTHLTKLITDFNSDIEIIDVSKSLTRLRQIKQPVEIRAINRAIDITTSALNLVKAKLLDYSYEYQLEADISHVFKFQYNVNHAFDPIVANGLRACILHNTGNQGKLVTGNLVTIDIGAEFSYYAADITRTYCLNNKITALQEELYNYVDLTQQKALNLLKPGILLRDYEKEVAYYLGEFLVKLKLIKVITLENIRQYFPHATSHFLGLDVHDVGDYNRPLEAGMVLTVEPGIYIADREIGVRIEDDVLITKTGNKVLSKFNKKTNLKIK